jgi:hypothetical protein
MEQALKAYSPGVRPRAAFRPGWPSPRLRMWDTSWNARFIEVVLSHRFWMQ